VDRVNYHTASGLKQPIKCRYGLARLLDVLSDHAHGGEVEKVRGAVFLERTAHALMGVWVMENIGAWVNADQQMAPFGNCSGELRVPGKDPSSTAYIDPCAVRRHQAGDSVLVHHV